MRLADRMAWTQANSRRSGFTLVEIALAIGIFAFAIVAILALFPIGLKSANDSRVETMVAQISRTVLSDLKTGTFDKARIVTGPSPTPAGIIPNPRADKIFSAVNLKTTPGTPFFLTFDSIGQVLGSIPTDANPVPAADYIVKVEWMPVIANTALTQVTVTVEAPASAPLLNRTKYPVTTLMGDTR